LGSGHDTLCNETLFENVLNLFPCGASPGFCELAYSFDDPRTYKDVKPPALFRSEFSPVFPNTF
jgi:hypothetical protein